MPVANPSKIYLPPRQLWIGLPRVGTKIRHTTSLSLRPTGAKNESGFRPYASVSPRNTSCAAAWRARAGAPRKSSRTGAQETRSRSTARRGLAVDWPARAALFRRAPALRDPPPDAPVREPGRAQGRRAARRSPGWIYFFDRFFGLCWLSVWISNRAAGGIGTAP